MLLLLKTIGPINFDLNASFGGSNLINSCNGNTSIHNYMPFKWDYDKADNFSQRLIELTSQMSIDIANINENVSQELIDQCYSDICQVFLEAAQDIGVCKWKRSSNNNCDKNSVV